MTPLVVILKKMEFACSVCCELDAKDVHIAGWGIGPDQRLYLLECLGAQGPFSTFRSARCDWRVRSVSADGSQTVFVIRDQIRNYDLIQPMPDGILLACSRCEFHGDETIPNGNVFDAEGKLARSILLGDGIESIQAAKNGDVWVAYFDEGVFGNYGWGQPVGSRQLLRFKGAGDVAYGFEPPAGLESIVDCYTLNVISAQDTWCYYYTDFAIVQIREDRVLRYWNCPIEGAHQLAIWKETVLMPSGYGTRDWTLLLLGSGTADRIGNVDFTDNCGGSLGTSAVCRGDSIWFVREGIVYRSLVRDLPISFVRFG